MFVEDEAEKCKGLELMFGQQTGKEYVFSKEQAEAVCVFKVVTSDFCGKQKRKG